MNFIRRFWIFGLIALMVGLHVMIICYVRSELMKIKADESLAVSIGEFQFQTVGDKSTIYQMQLFAVLEPAGSIKGRELINKQKPLLTEMVGQQLRQSERRWLSDPVHTDLKNHLKQEIDKTLNESIVEDLLITDWLELPSVTLSPANPPGKSLAKGG